MAYDQGQTVPETHPEEPVPQAPMKRFPPWSPLLALLFVLVVFLGTQFIGISLVMLYYLFQGLSQEQAVQGLQSSTLLQFAYVLIVEALTVLLLYLFVRGYRVPLSKLGLVRPRLRDVWITLLAIPPYLLAYLLLLAALTALFPAIDVNQEQQIGFEDVRAPAELILTFISLAILPPIVEELVMRGFLFTSMLKRYKFVIAALITSFIFGILHLQLGSGAPPLWIAAIDTFVLSMVLCYLRYRTGSLWSPIFLHGIKNSLAFTVLFLFPIWNIQIPGV